ncbi:hypothetical protein QFZ77_002469 [Paenibacillus sp. V4I3]|uniref:hypothetical protein n=1 Tax=Paenibacillus sp. V4I3 TaxID=3042305 RepID=UPI0027800A76|nr:hypothetical protein [Paenibacillus sp. V4I3]MDQ0873810.1 hypothetical protein [Paenibacillus sp. V4I3]
MSKKREYMMSPFRQGLDEDIRKKYNEIPDGKRAEVLRDAFRLWCGIDKKLVYEATEKPIKQPTRPPFLAKGVNNNGNSLHNIGPRRS